MTPLEPAEIEAVPSPRRPIKKIAREYRDGLALASLAVGLSHRAVAELVSLSPGRVSQVKQDWERRTGKKVSSLGPLIACVMAATKN